MRGERDAVGRPDLVGPERQRSVGGELGVELANRAGGRVAGVHERREARLSPALVELGEIAQRHVHLAAHLDEGRRVGIVEPQRDRADRPDVVRDVLPDLAVAAGRAPLERAVSVDEAHREAVDLRLGHVLEIRILDPLPGKVVAHPGDPRAQLVGRSRVREREHPLGMAHLLQVADRLAPDPLRRRVGRDQLWVLGLDRAELIDQPVVRIVPDLRIIEDVIPVTVVVELLAQLGGALGHGGRAHGSTAPASTSSAAGWISRARSYRCSASSPLRSVRSKWIGVTAIWHAATAEISVPGSSAS